MRGELYGCEWLEKDDVGRTCIVSRTRALWVPDAQLLFQWPMPTGAVQVSERTSFPPTDGTAQTFRLESWSVPYAVIKEARRYLKQQEHIRAQSAVVRKANDRLTSVARMYEGRLQEVLTKHAIRPS